MFRMNGFVSRHLLLMLCCLALWAVTEGCVCSPPNPFRNFDSGARPDFGIVQCRSDADCPGNQTCIQQRCRLEPDRAVCRPNQTRNCRAFEYTGDCQRGIQLCQGGQWSLCRPANFNRTEECNGKDDNCNGQIDETFTQDRQYCFVPNSKGVCQAGEYRCLSGKLTCRPRTAPSPEGSTYINCNDQLDNDCDGLTDNDPECQGTSKCQPGEKEDCYSGPASTKGVGPCKPGIRICSNQGVWGNCQNEVTPKAEVCGNQIDEDCDGLLDNGCSQNCGTAGVSRACYGGPLNTKNIGTCKEGLQTCQADGSWSDCQGQTLPTQERCGDKLDNDCNGKIDDNCNTGCPQGSTRPCYSGPKGTQGVGRCKPGLQQCKADGTWETCKGSITPTKENCANKIDDDCNGKIDDCQITQLATGSWDTLSPIIVWDIKTAKSVRTLNSVHSDTVYAAKYSPDGKILASASHDKQVAAWNATTGAVLWRKTSHTSPVYGVAFHPTGTWFATASGDRTIRLWETTTGKELAKLGPLPNASYDVAIDSSGRYLAATDGNNIRLWLVTNLPPKPATVATLKGHTGNVFKLAFQPGSNGLLASGAQDNKVLLWNVTTGKSMATVSYHKQSITALAFHPNGATLAVGSSDQSTSLWDIKGNTATFQRTLVVKNSGAIYSLAFHPQGKQLASGTYNNQLLLWDLTTYKTTQTLTGHTGPVSSVNYRP